jgi:hypothetical protein
MPNPLHIAMYAKITSRFAPADRIALHIQAMLWRNVVHGAKSRPPSD